MGIFLFLQEQIKDILINNKYIYKRYIHTPCVELEVPGSSWVPQAQQAHPVLKYRVPHGSHNKHTLTPIRRASSNRQRQRDRERERERETERQRDRETERQRDRETERQRDRETERQRDRETVETERQRELY
jgi:hypothetical protein